jgi:hypothetical protein
MKQVALSQKIKFFKYGYYFDHCLSSGVFSNTIFQQMDLFQVYGRKNSYSAVSVTEH